ncbi:hypothetical protein [uncultured Gammaproteobacteria bacterium]|nr:hypothetical protein [uncultured Gammaproteobacteria bacterium]
MGLTFWYAGNFSFWLIRIEDLHPLFSLFLVYFPYSKG